MAGLGHRAWTPGEVIEADNVQQYLQDQVVQVYLNSIARGSALVGFVSEGMLSYLKSTKSFQYFDGTNWTNVLRAATPSTAGVLSGLTDTDTVALGTEVNSTANFGVFIGTGLVGGTATGISNTYIGHRSGNQTTTGDFNTGIGSQTALSVSTGRFNTYIGASSGSLLTTGDNNSFLGYGAEPTSGTVSNQITLGNNAVTSLRCQVTSITSLSDERDKKDIEELPIGLDFIKQLKPVKFEWNERPKEPIVDASGDTVELPVRKDIPDFGFIAQDLVAAEDSIDGHDWLQLTLRDNPEKLEATQGRLIPILVKAIQELSAEVESLKAAQK